ncbi:N2227-domain-containing protein [Dichomitus squalens]|uniref:carnosine N-methyltransferase n=1 Tax=Dichomitus squalens TaxID=114155 RepID=A0A4Q9Q7K9_9APHY|nr:N2227-domain-containing protein [Dichomitus squalens]
MPFTQEQIEEEQTHFANVITTFQQYAPYALNANNKRRKDFHTLPIADRELLTSLGYKDRISAVDHAIFVNAEFLNRVIASPDIFSGGGPDEDEDDPEMKGNDQDDSDDDDPGHESGPAGRGKSHSHSHSHSHGHGAHPHAHGSHDHSHESPSGGDGSQTQQRKYRPTEHDMDKLRSTLKQLVRDWSMEGKAERDLCYEPIKEALIQHFSDIPQEERRNFRVLVPGAGLGRLAWDVAKLGFACQGNEFSHYMLLASFYMLNRTDAIHKHTIYPYVHSFSNNPNTDALLRPILIPDVLPSSLPEGADFSLVAGDFEEIYGGSDNLDEGDPSIGQWDAVLTCFFIDTAKNIVDYLRVIHRILAPGGVWINLGPLLWHWEGNTTNDPSVELTLDEVKALARKIGFKISNERTIDTTYTNNAQSMLGYVYHAAFWTATKVV